MIINVKQLLDLLETAEESELYAVKRLPDNPETGVPQYGIAPTEYGRQVEAMAETAAIISQAYQDYCGRKKTALAEIMEANDWTQAGWRSGGTVTTVKYTPQQTRKTFQQAAFRADHPDLAEAYTVDTVVKPYVQISTETDVYGGGNQE